MFLLLFSQIFFYPYTVMKVLSDNIFHIRTTFLETICSVMQFNQILVVVQSLEYFYIFPLPDLKNKCAYLAFSFCLICALFHTCAVYQSINVPSLSKWPALLLLYYRPPYSWHPLLTSSTCVFTDVWSFIT